MQYFGFSSSCLAVFIASIESVFVSSFCITLKLAFREAWSIVAFLGNEKRVEREKRAPPPARVEIGIETAYAVLSFSSLNESRERGGEGFRRDSLHRSLLNIFDRLFYFSFLCIAHCFIEAFSEKGNCQQSHFSGP